MAAPPCKACSDLVSAEVQRHSSAGWMPRAGDRADDPYAVRERAFYRAKLQVAIATERGCTECARVACSRLPPDHPLYAPSGQ